MNQRKKSIAGVMRHMTGWHPDRPDHRDLLMAPPPVDAAAIPMTCTLAQVLTPFDQETIGSCTANMGAAQMAWLEHLAGTFMVFSRQFIYAMTRHVEGTPLSDDSGAQIRDVMKALAQYGACREKSWPYDPDEQRFSIEPSESAKGEALSHQALFYYRCAGIKTIQASLVQGFPVGFGFSVPENMMSDAATTTGEVNYPGITEKIVGGHAVCAWGFDSSKQIGTEVGAFQCLNSWGSSWGQSGYFWLPYKFFTEGLANDAWTLRRIKL